MKKLLIIIISSVLCVSAMSAVLLTGYAAEGPSSTAADYTSSSSSESFPAEDAMTSDGDFA